MNWKEPLRRLHALLFRSRAERDLDEEMRLHLLLETRKLSEAGLDPADAKRRATINFGGTEGFKEECREVRGTRWVEDFVRDFIFGLRQLRKDRGYTIAAIGALALGIGANVAVFTVFSAVVLKPLPVPNPELVDSIWRTTPRVPVGGFFSYSDYVYYRDHNSVFANVAAETPGHLRLVGISSASSPNTVAEPIMGLFITSNYLATFGVRPIVGRDFVPEDELRNVGPYPAFLSDNYWQRRFGRDPGVLGETLMVSGIPAVIVGITPRDFMGTRPDVPDIWISASALGDPRHRAENRTILSSGLTGRLKPGVTLAQAQVELSVLANSLKRDYSQQEREWDVVVSTATRFGTGHFAFTRLYIVLQIAMGLVLMIACTNVAGLLLGRAAARQREIAVRLSLGASRHRLIRQLVTEGTLISVLAGIAAYIFAQQALVVISRVVSSSLAVEGGTIAIDLDPDLRAFSYVLLVSILTGISFALVPALQSTKLDLVSALREETAGFGVRRKSLLRGAMIAAQISVCLALLIGAALLSLQSVRMLSTNPGFETDAVINMNVSSPQELGYTLGRMNELQARLNERLRAVPGVISVSFASRVPLGGNITTTPVIAQDTATETQPNQRQQFPYTYVSQNFFQTLGIPLLRGRGFTSQEMATNAPVAVISSALARRLWPDADAIGKRVVLGSPDTAHFIGQRVPVSASTEVIGITRDIYSQDLILPDQGAVYLPKPPDEWNALVFVRIIGDANNVSAGLLREVHSAEPNLGVSMETLHHMIATGEVSAGFHIGAIVFTAIGLVGFALASVGVYSMVAYTITQQTREIGIRIALGARKADVLRVLLGASLKWVIAGIIGGAFMGVLVLRVLSSQIPQLFGGEHLLDPGVILIVSLGTGALAMIAAYLPANRATRLQPATILRFE